MRFSGSMLIALPEEQATRMLQTRAAADPAQEPWRLRPVAESSRRAQAESSGTRWLFATPTGPRAVKRLRGNPWDAAHALIDNEADGLYRSLSDELTRGAGDAFAPLLVEPDIAYAGRGNELPMKEQTRTLRGWTDGNEVSVHHNYTHWPEGRTFAWHLDDAYSELRSARALAQAQRARTDRPVRVAVIDTGYVEEHVTTPARLNKAASRDFVDDPTDPKPGAQDPIRIGKGHFPGHGCSVLSVLAGNRIVAGQKFNDFLGGAPDVEVLMLRVSDSVIHFFPSRMAMAIKYAVAQGCDVISISHGGLPSVLLAEAVNEAYENGTAIFAASGDFLVTPIFGLSSPRNVVYPAALSRVVAVTGVTATYRSYTQPPSFFTLFRFRRWWDWMLRGNYGPDSVMHEAIAAYAPNVPWAVYRPNIRDPNICRPGNGTSVATPQVSAAAALWLQMHRDHPFLRKHWRSWQKVESLYWSLFDAAEKRTPEGRSTFRYFGNGLLKARRALEMGVLTDVAKRPEARIGFQWIGIFLSVLPDLRTEDAAPAARARAETHMRMVRTEIAQLTHGSIELQQAIEHIEPQTLQPGGKPTAAATRFLNALRNDKRASRYLCDLIDRAKLQTPAPVAAK